MNLPRNRFYGNSPFRIVGPTPVREEVRVVESVHGGRFRNPPENLLEVHQACSKGLEAAQKGDAAGALENAKVGRKLALASYKEISTMPMELQKRRETLSNWIYCAGARFTRPGRRNRRPEGVGAVFNPRRLSRVLRAR